MQIQCVIGHRNHEHNENNVEMRIEKIEYKSKQKSQFIIEYRTGT